MVENRMPIVLVRTATPGGMPRASSTGRVRSEPEPTAALIAPARVPITSRTTSEMGSTRADPTVPSGAEGGCPRAAPGSAAHQVLQHLLQHLGVIVLGVLGREQQDDLPGSVLLRPVQQRL